MQLFVNSKPTPFAGGSLAEFLSQTGVFDAKGVAVALNQEVVSKEEWGTHQLQSNDQILIIEPTQGG